MQNITESDSRFAHPDKMSVRELLAGMNKEDKTVPQAIERAIPQLEKLVEALYARMKTGGRLFYIGAGTSGRLGVLDASELPPTFGVRPEWVTGLIAGGDGALRNAVEGAEDDAGLAWNDLLNQGIAASDSVIGIAASGTTPYVVGGVREARLAGCLTGCIACNSDSPLAQAVEYPVEIIVGPEFITGSTRMKAGTAQKLALNMISTSLMVRLGKVKGNKMVNMQLKNNKLINRGVRMLMDELHLPEEDARKKLMAAGSVAAALCREKQVLPCGGTSLQQNAIT
ncbi:MAG: N-acetylmuramic acid 6-phosphate etherase [Dysgonamonadaceae bacterium]|jgi:N-acetylmuramic acid 6-phosphate etherase|nr:N-acetylmuramic acid 6-phosphate etherase [Dysgonamonadaceae bacterium]